jgi:hypothetical protein
MATRNLVPRNSGEGGVGRIPKAWASGVFDNLYIRGFEFTMDQPLTTQDNVTFNSGDFPSGLTVSGMTIPEIHDMLDKRSGSMADFCFFSDAYSNHGVTNKSYYDTIHENHFISGISVSSADDLRLHFRWDGPKDQYMGKALINNIEIPKENIIELGDKTRRFEGYLDNLNLTGKTSITGIANGQISVISLLEVGAGPSATDIVISEISEASAKPGQLLGETHLKQGDRINVDVFFDREDIASIKVLDYGLAEEIDFQSYTISSESDFYKATIPVTISDRSGTQGIKVQAVDDFGTTGVVVSSEDFAHENTTRELDQLYPLINTSDPTSYNGRSDGLREGESATFDNSISNWDELSDEIEYEALSSFIQIENPNIFEETKSVNYVDGIFSDVDNIEIYAIRKNNGATDRNKVNVKIANGPVILSTQLDSLASESESPHIIGNSQVKAGDTVLSRIEINTNGVEANDISISIPNEGVADGSQSFFSSSYQSNELPNGNFEFTIPIKVYGALGFNNRDGDQPSSFIARNNFGTQSDKVTSTDTAEVHNETIPEISINSISYPQGQEAIKSPEQASINNTVINFDQILYSSPNNQISIDNNTTLEENKTVTYLNGDYNVENDSGINNFKISATRNANGATSESSKVVNIANLPIIISIDGISLPIKTSSTPSTTNEFTLSTNQLMLNIPSLNTSNDQQEQSILNSIASGTGKTSNRYSLTVSDQDTKGSFPWIVSVKNLSNIESKVISQNPNYILEGFNERTIFSDPNSIGAGLADIGTSVSNPLNLNFENISEGGTGPNGGTIYSYESFDEGTVFNNSFDINNKFSICDENGNFNPQGNFVFNLDKLNRSANTSTINPASFTVSE